MARPKKSDRWKDLGGGAAFAVSMDLLRHQNFTRLSPYANKLVFDLARQYTGFNNGYLCCSWTLMKECGWNSPNTLRLAMLELEHYKIIMRTKQGGLNCASLHGFTWRRIDQKKGKDLDTLPTMTPPDTWKHEAIPDFNRRERRDRNRRKTKIASRAA